MDRILASLDDGEVEVWSSLAEGADRLVATRAMAVAGAELIAVLPLDPDEYRTDFPAGASQAAFDELLGAAARTVVTGPDETGSRTSAYQRAGDVVARSVDVLIAVWDGEPARGRGGTAEIVDVARSAGTDVVVVPVTRAAAAP